MAGVTRLFAPRLPGAGTTEPAEEALAVLRGTPAASGGGGSSSRADAVARASVDDDDHDAAAYLL